MKSNVAKAREIRALLALHGIKQAEICRILEVKPASVCQVISGKIMSRRIRKTIAELLHLKVEDLWPDDNHKEAA